MFFTLKDSTENGCSTWNKWALSAVINEAGQLAVFATNVKLKTYFRYLCSDASCTTFTVSRNFYLFSILILRKYDFCYSRSKLER